MQLNRSAEDEIAYAFASPFGPQQRSQLQLQHRKPPRTPSLALTTSSHYNNSSSNRDYEANDKGDAEHEDQFRHFRKKRVVTATSLQLDVNDLKAQVANLLLLRSILENRAIVRRDDTAGSLVRTARAYYELFRNGYMTTARMTALTKRKRPLLSYEYHAAGDSNSVSQQQQALDQTAFLRSAMAPSMEAGPIENGGPPLKLEQWRRYSDYFALRDFRMTSCDVVLDDQVAIVRTKGEFTLKVTYATIVGVFPHLLESEDQGGDSDGAPIKRQIHQRLLDKILGLQLKCPCFIDLYFDATGRVNRYDEAGDFLRAFATVLKDPSDLATLFSGALLWEAGLIGALDSMGIEDTTRSFIAASPSSRGNRMTTSGSDSALAGTEGRDVSAASSGKQPATWVRKLYDIGFLLNHDEGLDSEAILDSQQQQQQRSSTS